MKALLQKNLGEGWQEDIDVRPPVPIDQAGAKVTTFLVMELGSWVLEGDTKM